MEEKSDFEACIRSTWRHMIGSRLPAAAAERAWPVATPAGFERILLDHVLGRPWEAAVGGPSGDAACPCDLLLAIEIAERALAGEVDLDAMNRRSLAARSGAAATAADGTADAPSPRRRDGAARRRRSG